MFHKKCFNWYVCDIYQKVQQNFSFGYECDVIHQKVFTKLFSIGYACDIIYTETCEKIFIPKYSKKCFAKKFFSWLRVSYTKKVLEKVCQLVTCVTYTKNILQLQLVTRKPKIFYKTFFNLSRV